VSDRVRLGISTCPNDTFAFCGWIEGAIDPRGIELEVEYLDVAELNRRFQAGDFDLAKISFHAALTCASELRVLPSGSALGYGVGPLLLASPDWDERAGRAPRVLCPGPTTTAALLWKLFHGERVEPEHVVFSEIMPRLRAGRADLGVCIHEGRFTWRDSGLRHVEDLGERWEAETETPLPLGGIAARRALDPELVRRAQACLADSIDWGHAHRERALPFLRRHAVELDEDVLWSHVELYVNAATRDLGAEGRRALERLSELAARAGLVDAGAHLEVFE